MTPREVAETYAKVYGVHQMGITVLGGKPYVNIIGLRELLRHRCEREVLLISRVTTEAIERPTEANNFVAGYRATVELWDRAVFVQALQAIAVAGAGAATSPETLQALLQSTRLVFTGEGWHSLKNEEMSTIRDPQHVAMKAETKAIARALRNAVNLAAETAEEVEGAHTADEPITIEAVTTSEITSSTDAAHPLTPPAPPASATTKRRGRPQKIEAAEGGADKEPEIIDVPGERLPAPPAPTIATNGDLSALHAQVENLRGQAGIDDATYTRTLKNLFDVETTAALDLKNAKVAISRLLKKLQPQT